MINVYCTAMHTYTYKTPLMHPNLASMFLIDTDILHAFFRGIFACILYYTMHFTTQSERDIRLPRMCKTRYRDLQSQYSVYSWFVNICMYMCTYVHIWCGISPYMYVFSARNTVTVGIFYSLPAFQLVFSQQLVCLYSYVFLCRCMYTCVVYDIKSQ